MADSNGRLDYADRIERASESITRVVLREFAYMDARPPFTEFLSDVLARYVQENAAWMHTPTQTTES